MSSLQYLEVVIYFLILTELTSFLLSFVLWSFQVLGKDLMDYGIRSGKRLSLGMTRAPQDNSRTTKSLSLGMPRKASPLSSLFIGNFTWSYIFIHHMICVLLGASIYFVRVCLLLFRTMFFIFYFNKSGIDSLYYAYVTSIHVAVWKQKVDRCCNNSLEKSKCDKMLKPFAY